MLSAQGGVEIEAVAETDPDAIAKIWIDPVDGLTEEAARAWVAEAKLNPAATEGTVDILRKLYTAYTEGDADLCEINPLILKPTGRSTPSTPRSRLDGNSMFRHPEYEAYEATQVRDEREQAAHEKGLQYVGLDGFVGVIANGAGLAMSHRRHREPGRRQAGQLPRHRRRRQRRRDGRRPRGHQQRPRGEVDLHQHLRRHHQGRRGRQRHRHRHGPRRDRRRRS